MIHRTSRLAALAGAALLAIGAGAVSHAQPAPGAPPPPAAGPDGAPRFEQMREHMQARRAEHARVLHDALSIRPNQERAWQIFQASMQPQSQGPHEPWGARMNRPADHPLTTPERLDRMADRMAKRQARFAEHAQAVKTFYASLDPTQQRTFDALNVLERGQGHDGPGGGRMGGGRHMGPPHGGPDGPPPPQAG